MTSISIVVKAMILRETMEQSKRVMMGYRAQDLVLCVQSPVGRCITSRGHLDGGLIAQNVYVSLA